MTACATLDLDAQPDAILVVVDEQFPNSLHKPAGRALVPQDLAAAAEVVRFAGLDSQAERLGVHIALHQEFPGVRVGRDHGDEPTIIEFRRELAAFLDLFDGLAGLKFHIDARHCWFLCDTSGDRQITGLCRPRQYCYHARF